MIEINEHNASQLKGTNRLICREGFARGWHITTPYLTCPYLYVTTLSGATFLIHSSTSSRTTYAEAHLVDDKMATYSLLADEGIYQLNTMIAPARVNDEARHFMRQHGSVVVKPVDSGHGSGVTVNVTTDEMLQTAIDEAVRESVSAKFAIIQQQFIADQIYDYRLVCIDKKFIAAIERVPARVYGDGVHTVRELIEIENTRPERGEAYREKLAIIPLARAERYLGDAISHVPQKGQEIRVLGIANYGAGGEIVDVTDELPDWMKLEAEKTARCLNLDIIGVDFMTDSKVHPALQSESCSAVIIEANKCPSLLMHEEPTYGTPRPVIRQYVDFLERIN